MPAAMKPERRPLLQNRPLMTEAKPPLTGALTGLIAKPLLSEQFRDGLKAR